MDEISKKALILSASLHVVLFIAAMLTGSFSTKPAQKTESQNSTPIEIEILGSDALKATKAAKPDKDKASENTKPKPKKSPDRPKAAPSMKAKSSPDLSQPKQVDAPKEDLDAPPEKQAQSVPTPAPKKPPKSKPKPPEPKEDENLTKKAPNSSQEEFSSLLKNLMEPEDILLQDNNPPEEDEQEEDEQEEEPQTDAALNDLLTNLRETPIEQKNQSTLPSDADEYSQGNNNASLNANEQRALENQLSACWNVLSGGRQAPQMTVKIKIFMNPDRTVRKSVILDQARYNRDSTFRAYADSAQRSLQVYKCATLNVPMHKVEAWKTIIVNFDPSQMLQ